jgi:hypothetical protein
MLVQGVVILFTVSNKKALQRHLLLFYIGQLVNWSIHWFVVIILLVIISMN